MAHWRQNHQSDSSNLTSADLYDEKQSDAAKRAVYREPIVTIERVSVGTVKSREKPRGERRNFIHVSHRGKELKKALGLNVTNCETLTSLSGAPDPKYWVGMTIQLYVDPESKYPNGKKGPAIRIKNTRPGANADPGALPDVSDETRERLEAEKDERLAQGEQEGPAQ